MRTNLARRRFLAWAAAGSVSAGVIGLLSSAIGAETHRPNILFILADDLGWGDLSCYGNRQFRTPCLDRFAAEGTLFTQFYQGGSVCSPSRCSLLTGRWPAEFRIHGHYATTQQNTSRDMSQFLDPSAAILPRLLRDSGYVTTHVGKWHLGQPPGSGTSLEPYGFQQAKWIDACGDLAGEAIDLWEVKERPRASRVLVDAAIETIESIREGPFYLQLWLNDPHGPLAPSLEQMKPFRRGEPPGFTTPFSVYAATVAEMDAQVGRLLARLDDLGLRKTTLVIFSSDNGPEDIEIGDATWSGVGSAGPLRGRKRSLYEGGVRVPFIVRWPGVTPAGAVNAQTVVCGVDLLPTICELAAAPIPETAKATLRGQSVASAFRGQKEFRRSQPLFWEWRFEVFNHRWNRSPMLAIRDGNWKLLLNPDRSRIELYDITLDPSEELNLAQTEPETVNRLASKALAWRKTLPLGLIENSAGKNGYAWPKSNP